MEWRMSLKNEVGLAGNPESVADEVIQGKGRAFLIVRLVLDALLYLGGCVGVFRRAVYARRTSWFQARARWAGSLLGDDLGRGGSGREEKAQDANDRSPGRGSLWGEQLHLQEVIAPAGLGISQSFKNWGGSGSRVTWRRFH